MKNEPEINHVPLTSPDEQETRIETLQRMFPDLFDGEGLLDEKAFRSLLSKDAPVARERFRLEWSGKTEAKRFAFSPSRATLRYDATQSRDADGTPSAKDASLTENTSRNILIEGDNLEVLKLLQKSFFESVKCIYIDPPYNTGSNYIYPNDYSQTTKQYWEETGTKKDGVRLVANPESSGRFHSNWLNMMYPRILAARKLLTDDGVLICAIDENELATLILMLKEVFGEGSYEYFYASVQHNPRGQQGINFSYTNEYMVFVYPAKGKVIADKPLKSHEVDWSQFRNWGGESLRTDAKTCFYPVIVENGEVVGFGDVCKDDFHPSSQTEWDGQKAFVYPIDNEGVERKWRYAKSSVSEIAHLLRARKAGDGYQIEIGKDFGTYKSMWTDKRYDSNEYGTKMINDLVPEAGFTYPKSLWAVYDAISTAVEHDKEAIVMDFFAGSGTTAHAVFQKNFDDGGNRKFVCVQIPEKIVPTGNKNLRDKMERALKAGYSTIFDITRARIAAAGQELSKTEDDIAMDVGFRTLRLAPSNFPENTFNPDPSKSEEENLKALEVHLAAAAQKSIFDDDNFGSVVMEIAIKFGFGLFYRIQNLDEDYPRNAVYHIEGNDKGALLCLDEDLHDETIEALKAHGDEQLIVAKVALDTTKKFELHNAFKDNLWVV